MEYIPEVKPTGNPAKGIMTGAFAAGVAGPWKCAAVVFAVKPLNNNVKLRILVASSNVPMSDPVAGDTFAETDFWPVSARSSVVMFPEVIPSFNCALNSPPGYSDV